MAIYDPDKEWCDPSFDPAHDGNQEEGGNGERRAKLDALITSIETSPQERSRMIATLVDLALYTGRPFDAISMGDLWCYGTGEMIGEALKYNASYSVVSTIQSRVCSFRPRSEFVPEAGNYRTQRLCRDRTAACDAWSIRENYQEQASIAYRDCLTQAGGVVKTYQETSFAGTSDEFTKTRSRRFPSWEIKVDFEDGKYGEPLDIHHVRYIPRAQALRYYGVNDGAREAILNGMTRLSSLPSYAGDNGVSGIAYRNGNAQVRVCDTYRRGPKGRHVLMVGDYIFYDDEWEFPWHPFDVFRFDYAPGTGYWGESALSKVRNVQMGMDDTVYQIDQAHKLSAKLFMTGPTAPEAMDNEMVQYRQTTPGQSYTFHNPQPIHGDSYSWFNEKKAWMFEILGVSQLIAQSQKSPGITAAVAIQAESDLQSDRLSQQSQMWEVTAPSVGSKWWDYESTSEKGDAYIVVQHGASREIKMSGLTLTDGKERPAVVRAFPTSLFGQSVPAKFQKAMDAVKAGWFDQDEILSMLGVPDLESVYKIKLAEYDWCENFMDLLLEDGQYETPVVWVNPIKLFDYARLRYLRADCDKSYPAENMADCRKLLDYLQPIAQAARDKASGKTPALPPGTPQPPAGPPAPVAPALPPPGAIGPANALPGVPAAPALPGLPATPEAPPTQ